MDMVGDKFHHMKKTSIRILMMYVEDHLILLKQEDNIFSIKAFNKHNEKRNRSETDLRLFPSCSVIIQQDSSKTPEQWKEGFRKGQ